MNDVYNSFFVLLSSNLGNTNLALCRRNYGKLLVLAVAFCLITTQSFAQRNISGKVTDQKGQGLPGVNVYEKGTTNGTITDVNGNYQFSVKDNATVVFSSIGYKTQEINVGTQSTINVILAEDIAGLEEIVVVGYGTQQREDVTGSISSIGSEDIEGISVTSFDAALQGKAAGLQVVQSNGVPGSAVRMRIRGQTSISGSSEPLYVVDGVPITTGDFSKRDGGANSINTNALADLNPNDIESIEVLKDAYASAIYGSRGANGVIIITTKKGKEGKTSFNLNYYAGITEPTNELEFTNSAEWLSLYEEAYRNSNGLALPSDFNISRGITPEDVINRGTDTDWLDALLRQGAVHEVSLSARGGNAKTRFYTGATYRHEESFLVGNSFERFNARLNLDNDATDKLKIGTQIALTLSKNDQLANNFGTAQSSALPIFPIYNPDGSYFGTTQVQGYGTGINPIAQLENSFETNNIRLFSNIYADYQIIEGLNLRAEFGFDYLNQNDFISVSAANRFLFPQDYSDVSNGGTTVGLPVVQAGSFEERRLNVYNWNVNTTLTYNTTFNELHNFTALGGFEAQKSTQSTIGIFTGENTGLRDPYFTNSVSGLQNFDQNLVNGRPTAGGYNADLDNDFVFASFFTRFNYEYSDKYLVGVSLRADGSSRFGPDNRFGFFPAFSAGWKISNEEFFQNFGLNFINYAKLRASFGFTGNAEIPNFGYLRTYGDTGGYLGISGFTPQRIADPSLTWENNQQLDIGLDLELLGGRISLTMDYYNKLSRDLLFFLPIQSSTGFGSILTNTDIEVRNRGFEFSVLSKNLVGELKWTTNFNISTNQNRVLSTGGLAPDAFAPGLGESRIVEGEPIGISYVIRSAGVDPQTGRELFVDPEGNLTTLALEPDERGLDEGWYYAAGNPFPDFIGGINNTFEYKGIEFSFLFTFSQGNTIYDNEAKFQLGEIANNNQRRAVLNRWQSPENPGDGETPGLFLSGPGSGRGLNSDRFIYDASFLRLRTITLAYNFPQAVTSKLKLSNLRVYVQAQNLFVFTRYPGWDPEFTNTANVGNTGGSFRPFGANNDVSRFQQSNLNFNVAQNPYPQLRSFTAGVNIGF